MRDIALEPLPDDPGDPGGTPPVPATAGDDAFAAVPPGGINAAVGLTDPSFASDKAYVMPSLGGEYGVGRSLLVGGPADGGLALLEAGATVVAPAAPVAKPAYSMTGRSNNQTTRANLYPWFKTPREGLDQNNVTVSTMTAEAPEPEPEPAAVECDPVKPKSKRGSRHD